VMDSIFSGMVTLVAFLVMLGLLVLVHELGHFLTAVWLGIKVEEFGFGFPPRALVLFERNGVKYTLNWLPIGGFVRLEGEDGDSDDPRSFTRAALPVKLLVLLAGVGMNLVLALVIFTATAWFPGQAVELQFQSVQADSPAATAGLKPGEAIVSIDGQHFDQFRVDGPEAMVQQLRARAGQSVDLGIISTDGQVRDVAVTLRQPSQIDDQHGALGIVNLVPRLSKVGFTRSPVDAAALGVARTADAFQLIIGGLRDIANSIATRPTEAPPASGPVGIAVQVGDVFWQAGPLATLYLAGILSANLALVNILPFPPLDGGRMLMIVLRSVVGNKISLQAERLTYLVGFGFLFAFLIWITYFDIARIGSGAPQ
jgi:regulator of sigma E protease